MYITKLSLGASLKCGRLFIIMAHNKKSVICAGTVVFRFTEQGSVEFLLVLPEKGNRKTWGFPKGHRESGELVEETAIRETYEETGVVPKLLYELPPVFTVTPSESKTVHFWLASQANGDVCPTPQLKEVFEVKWFNIRYLPHVHPYQDPIIKFALGAIEKNL